MNEFVEECRSEWKRLGVPDTIINEMVSELAADLAEAAAEGASAEEVLGAAAFEPGAFATAWAAERGVIQRAGSTARRSRRLLMLAAIAALTITTAIGAALVIFASPRAAGPSGAIRVPAILRGPTAPTLIATRVPPPVAFASPGEPLAVWIRPDGRGVLLTETKGPGVEIHLIGSILLIVGIVGIILSMLFLFWSLRAMPTTNTSDQSHT